MRILNAALLACASFVGLSATPATAATCFGNCGEINSTNLNQAGSVGVPPLNGDGVYFWVSTNNGIAEGGTLPGFEAGSTNGSRLVSDPFFAQAGQSISYYFNYITSDGAGFADYSWSQLRGVSNSTVTNLFTARTNANGPIAPGFQLPDVEAELSPEEVLILPGTIFGPLGSSSGGCFGGVGNGCGNSGWVYSEYVVPESGTYELVFGVSNWGDSIVDSALAFDGLLVGGAVLGDGSSPSLPALPVDILPNGTFVFEFTVDAPPEGEPALPFFIDPVVSVGYTYEITGGALLITEAWFGDVGDADGYQLYGYNDVTMLYDIFLTNIADETWYTFASPVSKFQLLGIDPSLGLDPTDTNAFVTGLKFNGVGSVSLTMDPITLFVPGGSGVVPEPATWAMMLMGFGAVGFAARRRPVRVSA